MNAHFGFTVPMAAMTQSIVELTPFCSATIDEGVTFWSRRTIVDAGMEKLKAQMRQTGVTECPFDPIMIVLNSQAHYLFNVPHDGRA